MTLILAISAYGHSGASHAARTLCQATGWDWVHLPDLILDFALAVNPLIRYAATVDDEPRYVPLADIVTSKGWERAKQQSEVRQLIQRIGTDAGRNLLGDDVWLRPLLSRIGAGTTLVTGVRYPNEAAALAARGAHLARVVRRGTGPLNAHPSESALDNWPFDYRLEYNEPNQLPDALRALVEQIALDTLTADVTDAVADAAPEGR